MNSKIHEDSNGTVCLWEGEYFSKVHIARPDLMTNTDIYNQATESDWWLQEIFLFTQGAHFIDRFVCCPLQCWRICICFKAL